MKMLPVQQGTGPLNPAAVRLPTSTVAGQVPTDTEVPQPTPGEVAPQTQVNAQNYSETPFDPGTGIKMPDVSTMSESQQALTSNITALLNGQSDLTPVCRQQLEGVAKTLGFRNLEMLQHHLRFLSGEQKQALLTNLSQQLTGSANSDAAVKQVFQQAFKGAINDLFTKNPRLPGQTFPIPEFKAEHPAGDASWDTAALASVYNGLSSIAQDSPERFAVIAKGGPPQADGSPGPMQFVRRQSPTVNPTSNIFDKMSQAVMIAHTDCDNCHVYLYDTAIKGDNKEIVNGVVGKLDLLSRMDPRTQDLKPVYTSAEIQERGLGQKPGESDANYNTRLRTAISTDLLKKYGSGNPRNLTDALNFVIAYKGLNDPRIVNPPIAQIDKNAAANDPAVLDALRRIGPSNMQKVVARMEQVDAVSQMQGFLKENIPGGGDISVDGLMGPQTRQMVQAFQASVALNTLKERIEDDDTLPEQRKSELLGKLNEQFQQLGEHPDQANAILKQASGHINSLVAETPSPLGGYTRQALMNDLGQIQKITQSPTFNRQTAEYLVNNWLNVMDSGKGLDLGEQLVVHESGHIWEHQMDQNGSLEVYENWTQLFDNKAPAPGQAGTAMQPTNTQDYRDQLHNDRSAASDYGATNPREDFAEASRIFTYDPQRLMRRSLMKFLYVNAMNGNTYKPADIIKMAKECGYSQQDLSQRLDTFLGQGNNGIRFSLNMSQKLAQTYAPLRHELLQTSADFSSAVAPGLSFDFAPSYNPGTPGLKIAQQTAAAWPGPDLGTAAPHLPSVPGLRLPTPGPLLPDSSSLMTRLFEPRASVTVPPQTPAASPDQAGWVFEQLSDTYRNLTEQLKKPGLNTDQTRLIHQQLSDLVRDFVSQGPDQTGSVKDLGPGAASFKQALGAPPLNYGEGEALQGRAMVAAMAIYRATGKFDSSQYPDLSDKLPPAFKQLLQEPGFQAAMKPGSGFDPTLQVLGALERVRWYERNQSQVQQQFADANANASATTQDLAALNLNGHDSTLSAARPATVSQNIPTLMSSADVQKAFTEHDFDLVIVQNSVNAIVNAINRLGGTNYPPLSIDDVKMYLISLSASGSQSISNDNLSLFLAQRQDGKFPQNSASSKVGPRAADS